MAGRNFAYKCKHCGAALAYETALDKHQRLCLAYDFTAARLQSFLLEHNHNGYIMTHTQYKEERAAAWLPTIAQIKERIGEWPEVAAWAGLKPVRHGPMPTVIRCQTNDTGSGSGAGSGSGSGTTDEMTLLLLPTPGMPAYPQTRTIMGWCIRSHTYKPVGQQTVYVLR
jgi:hypothetical protein